MTTEQLAVDNKTVAKAWQDQLPNILNETDKCEVVADEGDPNALRVNIATAGRTGYNFDFKVTYLDSREVNVQLVDVEKDGVHVDESTEIIQNLANDHARHMHECAQAVKSVTNP